jgi:hypothetical protein
MIIQVSNQLLKIRIAGQPVSVTLDIAPIMVMEILLSRKLRV